MSQEITATIEVGQYEARELILDNKGKFFGAIFVRKQPKCIVCNKRFKKDVSIPKVCPKCGGDVSFIRTTAGLLGVRKPKSGATVPGEGIRKGESFEKALSKGRVKYYDPNVQQKDGKGDYRQFCLELLTQISINHIRYIVVDVD